MTPIKPGDKPKDFSLKDHKGNAVNLSDFKGKKVVLSFHPLAWTGVCGKQMQSLERNFEKFRELGAVALGLSIDSVPSKEAWAKELGIKDTQLLADFWPHGGVAKSLGIFREENGFSERANIVLNEKGEVIFAKVYPIPELPDIDEILAVLKEKTGTKS
jgi:peroxiredoxin